MTDLDGLPDDTLAFRQAVEAFRAELLRRLDAEPGPDLPPGRLPSSEALLASMVDALGLREAVTGHEGASVSERSFRRILQGQAGPATNRTLVRRAAELLFGAEPLADVHAPDVAVGQLTDSILSGRAEYDHLLRVLALAELPAALELAAIIRAATPHVAIRLAAAIALAGRTSTKGLVLFEEQPFGALVDMMLGATGRTRRDLIQRVDECSFYAWCRGAADPSDDSIARLAREIGQLRAPVDKQRPNTVAETRRLLRCARGMVVARRALAGSIGEAETGEVLRSLRRLTDLALEKLQALPIEEHLFFEALRSDPAEMKVRLEAEAQWSSSARALLETGLDPHAMTALGAIAVHHDPESRMVARQTALRALFGAGPRCLPGKVLAKAMHDAIDDPRLAEDVAMAALGKWRERAVYWVALLGTLDELFQHAGLNADIRMKVLPGLVRPS